MSGLILQGTSGCLYVALDGVQRRLDGRLEQVSLHVNPRYGCRKDQGLQSVDGPLVATIGEFIVVFVAAIFEEVFERFVMQVAGDTAAPGINRQPKYPALQVQD